MHGRRIDRINQLLLEEIAMIVQRELSDPNIGFVTITGVRTKPDLTESLIFVSVLGDDERRKTALAALERAAPFIRNLIKPRIRIKKMPALRFLIDDTAERAERISGMLRETRVDDGGVE